MGKRHRKSFGGAVKQSLFAAEEREDRIDKMGDPLLAIEQTIDFGAIAARVDEVAPRPSRARAAPRAADRRFPPMSWCGC